MFLRLCTCYTLPLIYYRIQSYLDNQVYRAATSVAFKYGGQHDNRVTLSLVLKNQFMRITYIRKIITSTPKANNVNEMSKIMLCNMLSFRVVDATLVLVGRGKYVGHFGQPMAHCGVWHNDASAVRSVKGTIAIEQLTSNFWLFFPNILLTCSNHIIY